MDVCATIFSIYTIAFSLGVYCKAKSLSYSNVEMARVISPYVVAILDYLVSGRINMHSLVVYYHYSYVYQMEDSWDLATETSHDIDVDIPSVLH